MFINHKLAFCFFCFPICCLITACESPTEETTNPTPPNIIYILADDLGYGDLSCYGQTRFSTPNIDRLAKNGMLFTQHYSGNTVCAPSRSALLTGQHTGHTPVRGNKEVQPEGQYPLPDSIITIGETLKDAGYVTGTFGKWGLGFPGSEGDPVNQGFDQFYGYNCQRLAHHYYPYYLWDNKEKVMLEENAGNEQKVYGPELIHDQALDFIEQNKDTSFFLFYASLIPHAELFAPEEYMEKYRGKFPPEKVYEGTDDGERYRLGPYGSQPESHAAFVAMVDLLDQQVGEILDKVEALGLSENTLIVFTSDNGPHQEGGADPDYFDSNGPLQGYKRDLYEGGIRVPFLAQWKGKITPGSQSDHISAFWDFYPTACELAGVHRGDHQIDGISYLPSLLGQENQEPHEYLYWEFHERGGRIAIRKGNWKAVKYDVVKNPDRPIELYDLSKDIGETNDLAKQHPEIIAEMERLFAEARTESEVFSFNPQ